MYIVIEIMVQSAVFAIDPSLEPNLEHPVPLRQFAFRPSAMGGTLTAQLESARCIGCLQSVAGVLVLTAGLVMPCVFVSRSSTHDYQDRDLDVVWYTYGFAMYGTAALRDGLRMVKRDHSFMQVRDPLCMTLECMTQGVRCCVVFWTMRLSCVPMLPCGQHVVTPRLVLVHVITRRQVPWRHTRQEEEEDMSSMRVSLACQDTVLSQSLRCFINTHIWRL